jgi:UDP-N-acetylglucosamine diphosphorylase/glucosamine-1-phosphate N-acetyltransferase
MLLTLFEDDRIENFHPLTFTRPLGELRCGILKMSEKWEHYTGQKPGLLTRKYLRSVFTPHQSEVAYAVNSRFFPDEKIVSAIKNLEGGSCLVQNGVILAARFPEPQILNEMPDISSYNKVEWQQKISLLEKITDLFTLNGEAIISDFNLITSGRKSGDLHPSCTLIGPAENLFLEPGTKVLASVINTTEGPVYIGKNAEVMEGSLIRGPFVLGNESTLKMGAKIYGPVTIGPHCKVGGEVSSSVLFGYSNKAHDGFLGHSIIGEWCNLGAGTNNSNLKNNYSDVKTWNHSSKRMEDTGLIFCGLIMGDFSRCGINTMFNTGTVVDVCANIFGGDFVAKHIPSFTWGNEQEYDLEKALVTIGKIMARRKISLTAEMTKLLTEVYSITATGRPAS